MLCRSHLRSREHHDTHKYSISGAAASQGAIRMRRARAAAQRRPCASQAAEAQRKWGANERPATDHGRGEAMAVGYFS